MSRGAYVTSFTALEEFDVALALFASESAEALESIEPEIARKLEILESHRQHWEDEVGEWQSTYDASDPDEDDMSYIAYRLEQAETNLRNVCYWQGRVDEQLREFRRTARRFQEIVINESPKARTFVQQKLGELRDYVGLKVEAPSPGESNSEGANTSQQENYPVERITEMPLPSGFEWVRLADLDPAEISGLGGLVYKKDGLALTDMINGLDLLKDKILPEVRSRREGADSDFFWQLDQQNGRQGINSLQGIYDSFFRGDAIWVDRSIGQSLFTIGNGRHRIKAALDAGWPAVPAKIMRATLRKASMK